MAQPLWKISWQFLKKLNVYLPYDPAIQLLGIYQKKKSPHRLVHNTIAALPVIVKNLKQLKHPSTGEWILKNQKQTKTGAHLYNRILFCNIKE